MKAIEHELMQDGFPASLSDEAAQRAGGRAASGRRRVPAVHVWLADNYALLGRHDEAREAFERLLSLRNDLGLISEEYDVQSKRLVKFPGRSRKGRSSTPLDLSQAQGPARHRQQRGTTG